MTWVAIGIGAGVGALGGGVAANQVGEDPWKGAALGAVAGGAGGWAFAPAAGAGTAGAAGTAASASAAPTLTGFGTAAGEAGATTAAGGSAAAITAPTASYGAAGVGGAVAPEATSAGVASTAMQPWMTTQAAPSAFSGLGKNIAQGVAVNGIMAGGNAALNPKPTTLTPGQAPQIKPLDAPQFQRINFGR